MYTGPAIAGVTHSRSGNTAEITIIPNAPGETGAGHFNGAVAVTGYVCADAACSALAAGETETVTVGYQVSPVVRRVAPYIAIAGTSATAVVRGIGFRGFVLRGVSFGGVPATSFSIVSDSELVATYPALSAGSHLVQIDASDHQGPIPSTATLLTLDPLDHAATTLAYPAAVSAVRSLVYDPERRALLAATDIAGGTILRYSYANGSWSQMSLSRHWPA